MRKQGGSKLYVSRKEKMSYPLAIECSARYESIRPEKELKICSKTFVPHVTLTHNKFLCGSMPTSGRAASVQFEIFVVLCANEPITLLMSIEFSIRSIFLENIQ